MSAQLNTEALIGTITNLSKAVEVISKALEEEGIRRLALVEKYADLLERYTEIMEAREEYERNHGEEDRAQH